MRRQVRSDSDERSIISVADLRQPRVRRTLRGVQGLILVGLVVVGAGPLLWLVMAGLSTTQDLITDPLAWFPSGVQWHNLADAWTRIEIGKYLGNTAIIALGCLVANLLVTTTSAYLLSILRPRWGGVLSGAILATLFVPSVIALVPLYLTVVRVPGTNISLLNTFWAVWLPSAANAFNILVVRRFFDAIPRETIEAAQIDGAGVVRVFWQIVLPFSKPILGVISIMAVLGAWKDFLWPKLVLQDPTMQPISVALPRVEATTELSLQMAGMLLGMLIPVILFLVFQRQILKGVSMSGSVKG
ncbi:multiple sugar transport system permease protein [Salana multivorans]|uniref:Multiple sugar transport system permease protein n=1 Tax=Salana multivorans TaxID=120377 RepID=A0A3N2DCL7_9MICO|nr:carbohydrate ABC transporter permease [Salana multivorans]MBN8883615.1 carbohydrate ABC transporter permease [Salana multivorans]OJX96188.1 MAG: ABC transporter permease [Micrococcales bacterium 73-15]ROR97184.1 multiple sugar transport system permease protein [Salana multivorans]